MTHSLSSKEKLLKIGGVVINWQNMEMLEKNEFHIPIESDDLTAIDVLVKASGLSRQEIKRAMQKGCVWLENSNYTQRLRRAKKLLEKGAILHCYYDKKVLDEIPSEAQLISDEGHYSIWNKPAGMFSQGSKWGDHCTIYRWAEKHLKPERPAFIVHRLDRAASGLIILAHKKKIAAQFAAMFQKKALKKHYHVWVEGDFSKLVSKESPVLIIIDKLDDKAAESHVRLCEVTSNHNCKQQQSLLDVEIKTGRKHQIRRHLAGINYSVVGDRLYGTGNSQDDLQLKAVFLSFDCPETGKLQKYSLPSTSFLPIS